jgi:hypothetical protein
MNTPPILDACCGSRMMWFDRQNPNAVFADQRSETITVTDNSRGNACGTRTIHIAPDTLMDFRAMPFADGTFRLVAFDPPHLVHAGPTSWLAAKYGRLSDNWRDDLSKGFAECFRVLASDGVLDGFHERRCSMTKIEARSERTRTVDNTAVYAVLAVALMIFWGAVFFSFAKTFDHYSAARCDLAEFHPDVTQKERQWCRDRRKK